MRDTYSIGKTILTCKEIFKSLSGYESLYPLILLSLLKARVRLKLILINVIKFSFMWQRKESSGKFNHLFSLTNFQFL